jgi:hypothetical protein
MDRDRGRKRERERENGVEESTNAGGEAGAAWARKRFLHRPPARVTSSHCVFSMLKEGVVCTGAMSTTPAHCPDARIDGYRKLQY